MTLDEIDEDLDAAYAARMRILESQETVVGDSGLARRNRRADLEQVNRLIDDLEAHRAAVVAAANGSRRVRHIMNTRH